MYLLAGGREVVKFGTLIEVESNIKLNFTKEKFLGS